jgi:putative Mg2+ transporter-C (MgtC) family protein
MGGVIDAAAGEFADLSAEGVTRLAVRLLIAGVAGGLVGWERWRAGKAAGLRTHVLVAVGAAAFVAVPSLAGGGPEAVSRVLQGVAAGVGFLGAGCILTAAGIGLPAGSGAAAGAGRGGAALLAGVFGFLTLSALTRLERWAERQ